MCRDEIQTNFKLLINSTQLGARDFQLIWAHVTQKPKFAQSRKESFSGFPFIHDSVYDQSECRRILFINWAVKPVENFYFRKNQFEHIEGENKNKNKTI